MRITNEELTLFEKLRAERTEDYKVFSKQDYKGFFNAIVEKYPESAHFIYEMLQNADDVEATEVRIHLYKDRLHFCHNGRIGFSISSVGAKEQGHINAITAVGNSTKTDKENKIGKFGVGFKAVFQYTKAPEIYDDKFRFRIINYIIPESIGNDHPKRRNGETLFVFPFFNPKSAYEDIQSRLKSLDNPILFLRHLRKIEWTDEANPGITHYYEKTVEPIIKADGIDCNLVTSTEGRKQNKIIMFSKKVDLGEHGVHDISLGYYLTDDGRINTEIRPNIFCFFPTSQKFDLCFVSHAPFLLIDSRQQMKETDETNKKLVQNLAEMAGQSLIFLARMSENKDVPYLDDNIFDIIPLTKPYRPYYEAPKLTSVERFYEEYQKTIKAFPVLYSRNKTYVHVSKAVVCTPVTMLNVFDSNQLSQLLNRDDMDFLAQKICANVYKSDSLVQYLKDLGVRHLTSLGLIEYLVPTFLNKQPQEWIPKFYNFIRHEAAKLWKPRTWENFKVLDYPYLLAKIIKTSKGDWVAAYSGNGSLNVFLPIQGHTSSEYNIVDPELIKVNSISEFLNELCIKEPDALDFIQTSILPKYKNLSRKGYLSKEEIEDDFDTIYTFCQKANVKDRARLISLLKSDFRFADSSETGMSSIRNLFDPQDKLLIQYLTLFDYKDPYLLQQKKLADEKFEELLRAEYQRQLDDEEIDEDEEYEDWVQWQDTDEIVSDDSYKEYEDYDFDDDYTDISFEFIDYSFYMKSITKYGFDSVREFFVELGLKLEPELLGNTYYSRYSIPDIIKKEMSLPLDRTEERITDYTLFGLDRLFHYNLGCPKDLSVWLWNSLCEDDISDWTKLEYRWKYYQYHTMYGPSRLQMRLKKAFWLLGNKRPLDVTQDELLEAGYKYHQGLFDLLEIPKSSVSLEVLGATKEQIENEALGKILRQKGVDIQNEEDILELVRLWQMTKSQESTTIHEGNNNGTTPQNRHTSSNTTKQTVESSTTVNSSEPSTDNDTDLENSIFCREEMQKMEIGSMFANPIQHSPTPSHSQEKSIEQKVEELNERLQEEEKKNKEKIDLQAKADSCHKYSFEWFKTLLALEYQSSAEEFVNKSQKSVSISFNRIYKEPGSDRIYILKNPSRSIPMWIEEIGGMSIRFLFNDRDEIKFNFEVASVKDYTLSVKASAMIAAELDKIDWTKCTKATINVNNPIELVGSLKDSFNALDLEDSFNLKNGLANYHNMNFVFGPPGTGKTTWLANFLIETFSKHHSQKILVLGPTNKACDELCKKVIEKSPEDYTWLARFVATADEELEDLGVVVDRDSDLPIKEHFCLVSTMARLPFDGFRGDYYQRLMDIDWDYVIIDEASMVPLVQTMFAIYQFPNAKFYIAGDPMQIGPIVREQRWDGENIYTMINLNSFENPKTSPRQFNIINLPKQFRSLPAIGELFSQYSYDGKLIHHRSALMYHQPYLGEIDLKQINFVTFKVEKFDSIFGAKKLDGSNVHIYSALLAVEMCVYIAKNFAKKEKEKELKIGVICPYAPQSQLIDKLIEQTEGLPLNVDIQAGTIHSFQGGQCNIIFTVMNPPTGLKGAADKIFLNRQNIINVAISRAQNELIILMPHSSTEGYENLYELNRLGYIASQLKKDVNTYTCDEIEEIIFGQKFHIENNTFVTSHQLANVYTKPIKKYEIRIDEGSIDIQIGNK